MGENKTRRRARQPERNPLSRADVVDAALRYVDEHGLDALTMRALAKEMGVYPTALYWHVGTKAQLVAATSARVLENVVLPSRHDLPWDEWLTDVARLIRNAMHRHPNLAPIIGSELVVTTTALPFVERVVDVLERAGFSGPDLVHTYNAFVGFVLGWVTMELSKNPVDVEEGWQKDYAAELRAANPNTFPALTRNLGILENSAFLTRWDSGRENPLDSSFEAALEALVLGLRTRLA
ncbi:TetR/AcrR family transcriptional regulator [Streptomyces coffeae]|uniref:TetR/AcrR family transcriptional regulator C-terminal domain-containing protein n=1 Tax=Streptomyces coffeae TaxID=621382 RepID=A0ABS1NPQ6_9ACTN|nr:TetR/AcrR family transcriptional regulator [Streptomyces coffeae]MBL1102062.1 TetR/AcrR family transcriptional regulator C-terminal domain-containing protein [Streptomyces coffeae]